MPTRKQFGDIIQRPTPVYVWVDLNTTVPLNTPVRVSSAMGQCSTRLHHPTAVPDSTSLQWPTGATFEFQTVFELWSLPCNSTMAVLHSRAMLIMHVGISTDLQANQRVSTEMWRPVGKQGAERTSSYRVLKNRRRATSR